MAKKPREIVRDYEERQKSRGLKRMWVYIPDTEADAKSIRNSAKRLRKKGGIELPRD